MLRRPNLFIPLLRFRLVVHASSINTKYSSPIMMNTTSPLLIAASQQATTTRHHHHQSQASSNSTVATNVKSVFEAKRRQRELSVAQKLLELYNNASPSSSFADGPKQPKNDAKSATKADDDPQPSSLRAGIETFLGRTSPPLDPRDFFEKVAQWMEEQPKTYNDSGLVLYYDLCMEEKYFKSRSLEYHGDDQDFFRHRLLPEVKKIYDEIRFSQVKSLEELFKDQPCPIFPKEFPPTLCSEESRNLLETCHRTKLIGNDKDDTSLHHYVPSILTSSITESWVDMHGCVLGIVGYPHSGSTVASLGFGLQMDSICGYAFSNCPILKCFNLYFTWPEVRRDIETEEKRSFSSPFNSFEDKKTMLKNSFCRLIKNLVKANNDGDHLVRPPSTTSLGRARANSNNGRQKEAKIHLNIILDDIGNNHDAYRSLCCIYSVLTRFVNEYLLHEQNSSSNANSIASEKFRVHIIATGTGAHTTQDHGGSAVYAGRCIFLPRQRRVFEDAVDRFVQTAKKQNGRGDNIAFFECLKSIAQSNHRDPKKDDKGRASSKSKNNNSNNNNSKNNNSKNNNSNNNKNAVSRINLLVSDLVTDPRCATLFMSHVKQHFLEEKKNNKNKNNRKKYNNNNNHHHLLMTFINKTIDERVLQSSTSNKLSKFKRPFDVIGIALAVVALRLPKIPDSCPPELLDAVEMKSGGGGSTDDEVQNTSTSCQSLNDLLCNEAGVVVDNIRLHSYFKDGTTSYFLINNDRGLNFSWGTGRYCCSASMSAIWRFAKLYNNNNKNNNSIKECNSPFPTSTNNWSAFQNRFADFCSFISGHSTVINVLHDALQKENETMYNNYFKNAKVKEKQYFRNRATHTGQLLLVAYDPLYPLKKDWLIYPPSARVVSCSGVISLDENELEELFANNNSKSKSAESAAIARFRGYIFNDSTGNGSRSTCVIKIADSHAKYTTANVVVIGPGRLIVLHCASSYVVGSNNEINDISNDSTLDSAALIKGMSGGLPSSSGKRRNNNKSHQKFVDFLKKICFDTDTDSNTNDDDCNNNNSKTINEDNNVDVFTAIIFECRTEYELAEHRKKFDALFEDNKEADVKKKVGFFGYAALKRDDDHFASDQDLFGRPGYRRYGLDAPIKVPPPLFPISPVGGMTVRQYHQQQ